MAIPFDLIEIEKAPINLWDIEMNIRDFYRLMNITRTSNEEMRDRILLAREKLDIARILLSNLISPEDNEYVARCKRAYEWMLDDLGRIDKNINEIEKDIMEKHEQISRVGLKIPNSVQLKVYRTLLNKCMLHLVYYPIKNGYERFCKPIKKDGVFIVRDESLFIYNLFRELHLSASSLGSLASQDIKANPRNFGVVTQRPLHEERPMVPSIPDNVEMEESEMEEPTNQNVKDFRLKENEIFGDEYENY